MHEKISIMSSIEELPHKLYTQNTMAYRYYESQLWSYQKQLHGEVLLIHQNAPFRTDCDGEHTHET